MFIQYTREVVPMDSRTNTHDAAQTDTKRDTDTETESGVGLALQRPLRLHLRPPPIVHRVLLCILRDAQALQQEEIGTF
ncbi:hypothetical protein KC19_4G007000 [Ceratodon purpureus]|uniref:Uncharacterized protein n=1 Tax=Ceratodon purpureus TaxID=3225 RepID=A0A8T0I3Z5_CERPU|nr:hypothetical protein KC19_4G007000 [Ceratodon purpureus]